MRANSSISERSRSGTDTSNGRFERKKPSSLASDAYMGRDRRRGERRFVLTGHTQQSVLETRGVASSKQLLRVGRMAAGPPNSLGWASTWSNTPSVMRSAPGDRLLRLL